MLYQFEPPFSPSHKPNIYTPYLHPKSLSIFRMKQPRALPKQYRILPVVESGAAMLSHVIPLSGWDGILERKEK
jgi:hypothetical protein